MAMESKPLELTAPLLQFFDMPTSVKFYRDVLGFERVGNSPIVHRPQADYLHWCMLRRGNTTIMLNTAYDEGERPPAPNPPALPRTATPRCTSAAQMRTQPAINL